MSATKLGIPVIWEAWQGPLQGEELHSEGLVLSIGGEGPGRGFPTAWIQFIEQLEPLCQGSPFLLVYLALPSWS